LELYYQTQRFHVFWDETVPAVLCGGEGFVEGEELRTGLNKGIELLVKKRSNRWLAEMKKRKVHTEEDQRWIVDDWTPRAVAAGLRFAAFVLPTSVISKMSLKRMNQVVAERSFEIGYFDDLDEARRWLSAMGAAKAGFTAGK
jgi:hypothetical protein